MFLGIVSDPKTFQQDKYIGYNQKEWSFCFYDGKKYTNGKEVDYGDAANKIGSRV